MLGHFEPHEQRNTIKEFLIWKFVNTAVVCLKTAFGSKGGLAITFILPFVSGALLKELQRQSFVSSRSVSSYRPGFEHFLPNPCSSFSLYDKALVSWML